MFFYIMIMRDSHDVDILHKIQNNLDVQAHKRKILTGEKMISSS
jgi:hypothetical protein